MAPQAAHGLPIPEIRPQIHEAPLSGDTFWDYTIQPLGSTASVVLLTLHPAPDLVTGVHRPYQTVAVTIDLAKIPLLTPNVTQSSSMIKYAGSAGTATLPQTGSLYY